MGRGQVDGGLPRIDFERSELSQAGDQLVEELAQVRISPAEVLVEAIQGSGLHLPHWGSGLHLPHRFAMMARAPFLNDGIPYP
jgi:hypothetical protein